MWLNDIREAGLSECKEAISLLDMYTLCLLLETEMRDQVAGRSLLSSLLTIVKIRQSPNLDQEDSNSLLDCFFERVKKLLELPVKGIDESDLVKKLRPRINNCITSKSPVGGWVKV